MQEFCEQGDLARHIDHAITRSMSKFDVERVYSPLYTYV